MLNTLFEFFGVLGFDPVTPVTVVEFFTWFFQCLFGVAFVWGVFKMFRYLVVLVVSGGKKV